MHYLVRSLLADAFMRDRSGVPAPHKLNDYIHKSVSSPALYFCRTLTMPYAIFKLAGCAELAPCMSLIPFLPQAVSPQQRPSPCEPRHVIPPGHACNAVFLRGEGPLT